MSEDLKFHIQTYGCKVNTYDTGLLQQRMLNAKLQNDGDTRHVHILNTCAVTAEATNEALRRVRRLKRDDPQSVVVVTGCAAQVDTEQIIQAGQADLVIANSHKGQLNEILSRFLKGDHSQTVFKSNIFKKEELEPGGGEELGHTRSFLKIQDGCNSFCSFCVIPFARGKSRSIEPAVLVAKINDLASKGTREVVITGVHIGDYETETGERLEDLVEQLLRETSMPRFRISSLEPVEITDRLLALYQNPRLCPHFHMSLQSASSTVLRAMKRQYLAQDVELALRRIATALPTAYVGMDVIAGFPGESEAEHQETLTRLAELPWTRAHVFPYSQRPGTMAAKHLAPVSAHVVQRRAKELRALSEERIGVAVANQVGRRKQVLVLNQAGGRKGLSRDYWAVQLPGPLTPGSEIDVVIRGYSELTNPAQDPVLVAEPLVDTLQNRR